jgi:GNAT superfamily N-acetyltransferase
MALPTEAPSRVDLISDPLQISVEDVLDLFAQADWTRNRTRADTIRMLEHSDVIVLAKLDDRPIGFARAITDHAYRAFVEDVIVATDQRGTGIGTAVMSALERLVKAQGIGRVELTTQQVGFWQKLGYETKPTATYMVKRLD